MNKSANPAIARIVGVILYFFGLAAIVFAVRSENIVVILAGIAAGITCIGFGAILGLLYDIEKNTRR